MNLKNTFMGARRGKLAFTLIELLAVIAIIGVIASLLLGATIHAGTSAKKRMAEAQRDQLVTFIEAYLAKRGVYPPDNPNNTTNNPLFYELSGTTNVNGKFAPPGGDPLPTAAVQTIFGIGGFINTFNPGGEAGEQTMRTFLKGLKDNQKVTVNNGGQNYTLLCVPLPNPYSNPQVPPAPWNYLATPHATNNSTTFDLWVDIKLGGQKFRISNWNKQPQPLN